MKLEMEIIEIPCKDFDSEKFSWKGSSFEKIVSGEGLDFELIVREHFLGLGYEVFRGIDYDPKFRQLGAPDFYVEKDGRGFFIEVKSWVDSLRLEQIGWMIKYPDQEVKLAIVPQGFFESLDVLYPLKE